MLKVSVFTLSWSKELNHKLFSSALHLAAWWNGVGVWAVKKNHDTLTSQTHSKYWSWRRTRSPYPFRNLISFSVLSSAAMSSMEITRKFVSSVILDIQLCPAVTLSCECKGENSKQGRKVTILYLFTVLKYNFEVLLSTTLQREKCTLYFSTLSD